MTLPSDGFLEAIWIKPEHGAPMQACASATLVAGAGLVGNADQGGRRQVTMIHRERWDAVAGVLGVAVDPSARRANLLLRGLPLAHATGRVLRIGACRIRIGGETTPCEVLDRAVPGLAAALQPAWGGGAYGEVLDDAVVAVGAPAWWEPEPEATT